MCVNRHKGMRRKGHEHMIAIIDYDAGNIKSVEKAMHLLTDYGLLPFKDKHPNELSGGMRQRVMIAMALACRPKLLIADEPTTALDVTIQAQILTMICNLQRKYGTSVIMITHDLGVVAEIADDVSIMKDGEIVENGTVEDIFYHPQHSYTKKLLDAVL